MLVRSVENEKFSGDGAGNEAWRLKLGQLPRSTLTYQTLYSPDRCCFSFWNKLIWQGNINSALSCWESCVQQEIFVHLPWLSSQGRMWKIFLIHWLQEKKTNWKKKNHKNLHMKFLHIHNKTKPNKLKKDTAKKRNRVCRRTLHRWATRKKNTIGLILHSG